MSKNILLFIIIFTLLASTHVIHASTDFFTISQETLENYKNVSFPVVDSKHHNIATNINNYIKKYVKHFIQMERDSYKEDIFVGCQYEVTYNNNDYLSLKLGFKYGLKGWPQFVLRGLTFYADTGQLVTADTLDVQTQNIMNGLRDKAKRENLTLNKNLTITKTPQNFYFDKNFDLHFIFDKGEIATEASGIIDLRMTSK